MLEHQLEKVSTSADAHSIESDISPELYVEASELLGELFGNVIENAIEHNPSEGLVVSVAAEEAGGKVVVTIEDNGTGIPEDIRTDAFEPGVCGDHSGGDGLGLYLVGKLVDAYNGTVRIDDTDRGTRFRVRRRPNRNRPTGPTGTERTLAPTIAAERAT